jgi:predicted phage terminase large subunit-like protein
MAIFDYMENYETVENPRTTKKIIDWIRGAVLGSLGKGYSAIMVGNLFHPLSAISKLIAEEDDEGKRRYVSKVYDAILDEGTPEERSLWPANWPMERLMKKKHDVGTYTFNKEYRNKVGTEDTPFPEEQVKYYERIEVVNRELIFCTAVDASGTSTRGSDFRSVVTFGLDPKEMVFPCMHAWIKRRPISEMFAAAYQQNDLYPGIVVIEENMFKDFLHEAIQNYAKEAGRFLPWSPIQHNANKIARIVGTCSYLWEHGKILFEKNHSDQSILIEQFVYIFNPTVHDDGPDAAEMAISNLQGGCVQYAYSSVKKEDVFEKPRPVVCTAGLGRNEGLW